MVMSGPEGAGGGNTPQNGGVSQKKSKSAAGVGWLLFLAASGILLVIIVIGAFMAREPSRPWEQLAEEHVLSPTTVPVVDASLRVTELRDEPVLEVRVDGLTPGRPLEIWFTAPAQHHSPYLLASNITVDDTGQVETDIAIPEQAWHRHTHVIGRQERQVVFRAPL